MKPRIFIGSSVEALDIANTLQENLDFDATVTVWNQGIFNLSSNALDDLITALGNFDFGIFVFKPDDITYIRSERKNTVRDNIIFELGLFIGRLGKEKVFYLTPRNCDPLHIPTDLLGNNGGNFDLNREDGNLKAALGPFCNQVRMKLKNFVYNNLNDLQGESTECKKIAIERPFGWEYLLAAELLSIKTSAIALSYGELEKGLVFVKAKYYGADEYLSWYKEALIDMQRFCTVFSGLTADLKKSFGPPGVEGIPLEIKLSVERITSVCKELLAWEYRLLEVDPPTELAEIKEITKGWSKVLFESITKLPSEIRRVVQVRKLDKDSTESINFVVEVPEGGDRVAEIFKEYYLRLRN